MFSSDSFNSLFRELMAQLNCQGNNQTNNGSCNSGNTGTNCKSGTGGLAMGPGKLTPAQVLVVAGLLGGVFEVTSLLIDKDQLVQIILSGSLKQKTKLEKMLDQMGGLPFDEVVKAMLDRLM